MDRVVFDNPTINGGLEGARVDRPSLIDQANTSVHSLGPFTIGDGKQPNPLTTVFCLVVAVVLCYAAANLRRSTTGRQMLALRSNERAAAAAGIDVARTKTAAFAVSTFIAGIGGAVIAYRQGRANQRRVLLRAVAGDLRLRLPGRHLPGVGGAGRRRPGVGGPAVHLRRRGRRHPHRVHPAPRRAGPGPDRGAQSRGHRRGDLRPRGAAAAGTRAGRHGGRGATGPRPHDEPAVAGAAQA